MVQKIAIIGAGLAGLTLAHRLRALADITIFEKSYAPGGRMSTRHKDGYSFDHGAQYFSAKSETFQIFLKPFLNDRIVQEWKPKIVEINHDGSTSEIKWQKPRYTAAPHMRRLCEAMGQGLNIEHQTQVTEITKHVNKWVLSAANGKTLGPYDWVITAIPAAQATQLLPIEFAHHQEFKKVVMKGCYALMLGFEQPLDLPWDAALCKSNSSGISWISVNSTKPDRTSAYTLLAQTSNNWADAHLDDDQDVIKTHLIQDLERLLGFQLPNRHYQSMHRWRHANATEPLGSGFLLDGAQNLAACGDWCIGGKVEAAFLSADALALSIKDHLVKIRS